MGEETPAQFDKKDAAKAETTEGAGKLDKAKTENTEKTAGSSFSQGDKTIVTGSGADAAAAGAGSGKLEKTKVVTKEESPAQFDKKDAAKAETAEGAGKLDKEKAKAETTEGAGKLEKVVVKTVTKDETAGSGFF